MNTLIRRPVESKLLFRGRPGDPRLGEWVLAAGEKLELPSTKNVVALFGCPDDTGVLRNLGRAGAKGGPEAIRKYFYKMTPPMDVEWESRLTLLDAGDIVPAGDDIVETHRRAHELATTLAASGATVVTLGGGHDFAAPSFLGFLAGLGKKTKPALVNVDPHLDMRPLDGGLPHSGTPFRQILDAGALAGKNHTTFGARSNRNSREAYAYAKAKGTRVMTLEALRAGRAPVADQFRREIARLEKSATAVGVTVDIDSCCDAEGSSAAPVLGFSAAELFSFAEISGRSRKVRYFEIAEVAPALDDADRSARVAAELLYAFLRGRSGARFPT